MNVEEQKRAAAARALDFVRPGMRLGLGTGSTAYHLVDLLGARVKQGIDVIAVPTSEATRAQAQSLGIKLTTANIGVLYDSDRCVTFSVHLCPVLVPTLSQEPEIGRASCRERV